ncbi:MAG: EamA family transporter, partial [Phycisphaerales bacterium]
GGALALFVEVGMRLLQPWPLKFVLDAFTGQIGGGSGSIPGPVGDPGTLILLCAAAVIGIALARAVSAYYSTVAFALRPQIIFVAIGALILFPAERRVIRSRWFIFGGVMVIGGVLFVIGQSEGFGSDTNTTGLLLALGAALGFSGYALAIRPVMKVAGPFLTYAVVSAYTAVACLVMMVALADRVGSDVLDLSAWLLALLGFSALLGLAIGHTAYYTAIKNIGVTPSTALIQLQPFTVAACEVMLPMFAVTMLTSQWIAGGVAIIGAIVMLSVQHRIAMRDRLMKHPDPVGDLAVDSAAAQFEGVLEAASETDDPEAVMRPM